MYKPTFTILLALCLIFVLNSCKEDTIQPELYGSISGVVRDAVTSQLLVGASITTNPATNAIVSDANGAFTFASIPVDTYTISASLSGYKKATASVSVHASKTAEAVIFLEKSTTINTAPAKPVLRSPPNRGTDQSTNNLSLIWKGSDPDPDDTLTYRVNLFESNSTTPLQSFVDLKDTSVEISKLRFNTTYYWQVTSRDVELLETQGDVWTFKTRPLPANRFVFTTTRDGDYEIYSSDSTILNTIRLTEMPSKELWPRWNMRGDYIAFSSDVSGAPYVYRVKPDGSELYRLTPLVVAGYYNHGMGFSWSPDGGWVVFSNYEKLYKVDVNGANLTYLAMAPADRHFRECAWSPLGDKIAVVTLGSDMYSAEIYVMNQDGSNMQLVMDNVPGMTASPSISPDGRYLMYTQDRSGYEAWDKRQTDASIMIYDFVEKDTITVSQGKYPGTNDTNPRFSPDGAYIVFENAPNDGWTPKDIWVMRADGTDRRRILQNGEMPDWH